MIEVDHNNYKQYLVNGAFAKSVRVVGDITDAYDVVSTRNITIASGVSLLSCAAKDLSGLVIEDRSVIQSDCVVSFGNVVVGKEAVILTLDQPLFSSISPPNTRHKDILSSYTLFYLTT